MSCLCNNFHATRPAGLLASDHEKLKCYMGEIAFNAMALTGGPGPAPLAGVRSGGGGT